MTGHSAHDDAGYVPQELFEFWEEKDPIRRFERYLTQRGIVSASEIEDMQKRIIREIDEVIAAERALGQERPLQAVEHADAEVVEHALPPEQQQTLAVGVRALTQTLNDIKQGISLNDAANHLGLKYNTIRKSIGSKGNILHPEHHPSTRALHGRLEDLRGTPYSDLVDTLMAVQAQPTRPRSGQASSIPLSAEERRCVLALFGVEKPMTQGETSAAGAHQGPEHLSGRVALPAPHRLE